MRSEQPGDPADRPCAKLESRWVSRNTATDYGQSAVFPGTVQANGVELSYEITGQGEPLLLVMGLGGQLTDWHPGFVDVLAARYTVITFDNRDIGLSTYSDAPVPTRWELIKGSLRPSSITPPYELADMAADAAGLLRAVDIESAHIVGMSMGGMIAQLMAIEYPSQVSSLCSIMSNTGDRRHGRPSGRVLASLARRGQPARDETLEVTLELFAMVGGADWDRDEQRRRTAASLERAFNPAGVLRQSQAIAASPDRTAALATVSCPSLVIHGLDDTLVRPSGGVATARAIPGSRLLMLPRMGHDLPATRHHDLVEAIAANTARAKHESLVASN